MSDTEVRPGEERLGGEHCREPWRSAARVDIDRLLYSPEFRRLNGVTQVLPPQFDYQFHDRLTHSVKVAQVASSLARELCWRAECNRGSGVGQIPKRVVLSEWVDPDYCYAAALAHDIGHPPFGHAGEQALQFFWKMYFEDENGFGDGGEYPWWLRRSFEGNAQSMRLVARLALRSSRTDCAIEPGLNLTLRSLAGIAKYPWLRGGHPQTIHKLANKWSFYPEEQEVLDRLVEKRFIVTQKNPDGSVARVHRWVEAEIMDWADDISYAVHDIEDFYRAGFIPLEKIIRILRYTLEDHPNGATRDTLPPIDQDFVENSGFSGLLQAIRVSLAKHARDYHLVNEYTDIDEIINTVFRDVCGLFTHLDVTAFDGTRDSYAALRRFSSQIIHHLSKHCELVWKEIDGGRLQLKVPIEATLAAEFFKFLNKAFVINNTMLSAAQFGQSRDIQLLCTALIEQSTSWFEDRKEENWGLKYKIPSRLRGYLEDAVAQSDNTQDPQEIQHIISTAVIDYICSLSDYQASRLAAQLKGSNALDVLEGRWLEL